MKKQLRQSGSSLLIILLIMSAVGAIVLGGSRAIIDASRLSAAASASLSAERMAEAGIQDAVLLYKGFLKDGEYGEPNASPFGAYSLKPQRRGFTDANCTLIGQDQPASAPATKYNPDCPYYDFTIRNTVAFTTDVNFAFSTRVFPPGQPVLLMLKKNPGIHFAWAQGFPLTNYRVRTFSDLAGQSIPLSDTGFVINQFFDISNLAQSVEITANYAINSGPHASSVLIPSQTDGSTTQIAIGKGYTTIDVTGYAGNVQKKLLLTIRAHDRQDLGGTPSVNPTYNLLDFTQTFDQNGVLKP